MGPMWTHFGGIYQKCLNPLFELISLSSIKKEIANSEFEVESLKWNVWIVFQLIGLVTNEMCQCT